MIAVQALLTIALPLMFIILVFLAIFEYRKIQELNLKTKDALETLKLQTIAPRNIITVLTDRELHLEELIDSRRQLFEALGVNKDLLNSKDNSQEDFDREKELLRGIGKRKVRT